MPERACASVYSGMGADPIAANPSATIGRPMEWLKQIFEKLREAETPVAAGGPPPPGPANGRLKEIFEKFEDVETLVRVGGLTAMTIIVFAETGLLVGFFLPGDSLLVTAGVFAATGQLNIVHLNLVLIVAAILGDTVGYWFGRKTGPALFKRPKSLLFNPAHLKRAHDFYEKHGGKTIVIARFMPIVRTFAPIVAGMGQMEYR